MRKAKIWCIIYKGDKPKLRGLRRGSDNFCNPRKVVIFLRINVLGIGIDHITMEDAVKTALSYTNNGNLVFTPNPEIIMSAQNDEQMKEMLNGGDLVLPDGIGVVIASKILKQPLPERVPGFDFCCNLMEQDKTFYFFGGKPGVAETAAQKMLQKGVKVVGTHHGYFDDDTEIINDINEKNPDVLLVCLGMGKQEKWMWENRYRLNTRIMVGAGGTLDVLAGNVKRAPKIFQKLNLEWLYRVIKQPSRIPRIMVLPKFLLKVIFKGEK